MFVSDIYVKDMLGKCKGHIRIYVKVMYNMCGGHVRDILGKYQGLVRGK